MVSFVQKALLFAIRLYRGAFTPLRVALGLYGCCRFTPTCSQYAEEALCTHGLWRGLSLTLWRLLRCHPWGGYGPDPVPPRCCDPHKTSLFC